MRNFMILATAIWLAAVPLPAGTEDAAERVQVIRCLPKSAAPVVWGMQKLHIRED